MSCPKQKIRWRRLYYACQILQRNHYFSISFHYKLIQKESWREKRKQEKGALHSVLLKRLLAFRGLKGRKIKSSLTLPWQGSEEIVRHWWRGFGRGLSGAKHSTIHRMLQVQEALCWSRVGIFFYPFYCLVSDARKTCRSFFFKKIDRAKNRFLDPCHKGWS